MRYRMTCLGAVALTFSALSVSALELSGKVVSSTGEPLAGAMVTVAPAASAVGSVTTTVFAGADGAYRVPTMGPADPTNLKLTVRLAGYTPAMIPSLSILGASKAGVLRADLTLAPTDNLAGQVPASAWMQGFPDDADSRHALWICAGCHQSPSSKMQRYAALTNEAPETGRRAAWHAMAQYMRIKTFDIGPEGSAWPSFPWEVKANPALSGWDNEDEAMIARALAAHLPTNYTSLKTYDPGAPLGVTSQTVIREYQMPPEGFTREVGLSSRSPYVWGAEQTGNRLVRLDPRTGAVKYLKVPFDGPSGPHTIVDDERGNLWITTIDNDIMMRLDPETEQLTLYQDFGKDTPKGGDKPLGGGAMVHDMAIDSNFQLARDKEGRIWTTLIGANKVGGINPDTREVVTFDAPLPKGKTEFHTALYGIVMNSAKTHVWYAQLGGGVGSFNVETLKFEDYIPFEMGEGPRRLAIDERDRIYVPLMGASQVFVYDTRTKKEIVRAKLPDRWAATYNVTWDSLRNCLWVGTTNADVIYRMDPETYSFTRYPLPRPGAFLRMITFDRRTGNLWTAYSGLGGDEPKALVEIDPGDGVRPAALLAGH